MHKKGEYLTQYSISAIDEELMVVEADGMGGADLIITEGPYPFMENCMLKFSHHFDSEEDACNAATWLDEHIDDVELDEFFEALEKGQRPHADVGVLESMNLASKKE